MNQRIKELIQQARRVLACSHSRPDGDAISSLLAMGWALERLGKDYTLVSPHPVPSTFRFLPGWEKISQKLAGSYDLVIALDSGSLDRFERLCERVKRIKAPLLVIDHHITNAYFGTVNWVEPEASATTEMLFFLFQELGLQLDERAATYLLTGIVTDTLGFRTSNVTPRTVEVLRELMKAGASLSWISDQAFNRRPLSALRLWAAVLPGVQHQDHIVWGEIPLAARKASGYPDGDDADLVELLATVEEAQVAVIFYEREDGKVKVSLRSRPGINVAEVAQQLGGGGHAQAAGAIVEGPLEAARQRVLALLIGREAKPGST